MKLVDHLTIYNAAWGGNIYLFAFPRKRLFQENGNSYRPNSFCSISGMT